MPLVVFSCSCSRAAIEVKYPRVLSIINGEQDGKREPRLCQSFILLKLWLMHCSNLFDFNDREEETCHFSVISHMPLATSFEKIMIYKPPAVWQMLGCWHVLGMWRGRDLRGFNCPLMQQPLLRAG